MGCEDAMLRGHGTGIFDTPMVPLSLCATIEASVEVRLRQQARRRQPRDFRQEYDKMIEKCGIDCLGIRLLPAITERLEFLYAHSQ